MKNSFFNIFNFWPGNRIIQTFLSNYMCHPSLQHELLLMSVPTKLSQL